MPKDNLKEKDKKFVCTGCERKFTTQKGLTSHHNVCARLRESNDQPVTSENPKKNKKNRRLIRRLFSRNSQASSGNSVQNVIIVIFLM
jgi:hypothetical protein